MSRVDDGGPPEVLAAGSEELGIDEVPVRRTDMYGRVTTYDTPLDATTAIDWHVWVRQTCLGVLLRTLPRAVADPIPSRHPHEVDFTVTLTNPTTHIVWVLGADYNDGVTATNPLVAQAWTSLTDAPWISLPAGSSAKVQMSIQAGGCSGGVAHVPFARTAAGQFQNVEAIPFLVAQSLHPLDGQQGASWAVLNQTSAARLDAQLATVCPPQG